MAFKMKGHTLPGIKQKNGGKHIGQITQVVGEKVDLTRTPVGPVAKKKSTYDEKEEQIIENMDNAKDNNFSQWGHDFVKTNKAKKKSPAKIAPLVAMAGKAIIGGVVKKAMEKDSPAKMCGCGKKKCNC